ncbi:MAG: hypothetical protein EOP32_12560 [Rhodococcus sp. (in: high G+C Gram-positive bacteria)]|nr:MAG: hypothetical protein EOP32_12560 [Rhodococcus sp. (in: high G+C Gram-positive bacteria)]
MGERGEGRKSTAGSVVADAFFTESAGPSELVVVLLVVLDVVGSREVDQQLRVVRRKAVAGQKGFDRMYQGVRLVLPDPPENRFPVGSEVGAEQCEVLDLNVADPQVWSPSSGFRSSAPTRRGEGRRRAYLLSAFLVGGDFVWCPGRPRGLRGGVLFVEYSFGLGALFEDGVPDRDTGSLAGGGVLQDVALQPVTNQLADLVGECAWRCLVGQLNDEGFGDDRVENPVPLVAAVEDPDGPGESVSLVFGE